MRGLKQWRFLAAGAGLALVLGLAACGGGDDNGGGGGSGKIDLTIGDSIPLTGDLADFGPPGQKASDLAVSVVKNSVAQIAAFLFPALVLLSLLFDPHLTFVLSPVFIGALVVTALTMWQITGDGEALLFEGAALVGLYVILATVMWFE